MFVWLTFVTVITDPNGRLLFQLTNQLFSFQPRYNAEDANGQPLFTVKKKFGCESVSLFAQA